MPAGADLDNRLRRLEAIALGALLETHGITVARLAPGADLGKIRSAALAAATAVIAEQDEPVLETRGRVA